MRFDKRTLGVAVVAVAVGALGAPAGYSAAKVAIQEVLVANGDDQPVPTKPIGTTAVAGSVSIDGTPSVSINGTPAVSVANSPTVKAQQDGVYEVREDRGEPFAQSGHDDRINIGSAYYTPLVEVPAGKDLIVERVSAQASGPTDLRPRPAIVATGGSVFDPSATRLFLPFVPGPAEGSAAFNEELGLYVPELLRLGFNSKGGTLDIDVALDWTVIGRLVDEPA